MTGIFLVKIVFFKTGNIFLDYDLWCTVEKGVMSIEIAPMFEDINFLLQYFVFFRIYNHSTVKIYIEKKFSL